MIEIFMTKDEDFSQINTYEEGSWIALTDPTATELLEVSERFEIDVDHLRAALDEEERSRIEIEDTYTLIVVDIPSVEDSDGKDKYITIPMAIIITDTNIITVCLEDTTVLKSFKDGRVKEFYTFKKTRFILQMLYRNATVFLQYLRVIDRKSEEIESTLHKSPKNTKNKELISMLELEKSLVYFSTSLRSNEVVLEKLLRTKNIKQYPEDTELLEDVIVENKQAIEMAGIYTGILSSMTDSVASIISNNLNRVMKFTATVTIVMSIPTIIASFYGMNVGGIHPGMDNPYAFMGVIIGSIGISGLVAFILAKLDMF
jgi:magnesium transporter